MQHTANRWWLNEWQINYPFRKRWLTTRTRCVEVWKYVTGLVLFLFWVPPWRGRWTSHGSEAKRKMEEGGSSTWTACRVAVEVKIVQRKQKQRRPMVAVLTKSFRTLERIRWKMWWSAWPPERMPPTHGGHTWKFGKHTKKGKLAF